METIEEVWGPIRGFDNYQVSSLGWVMNVRTGRFLQQTPNRAGIIKVGLVGPDGVQTSRSVKTLVAEAFVDGRDHIFNTPIQLDGYQDNNEVSNLLWRPRWFAILYTRQFSVDSPITTRGPIHDVTTGVIYRDVYEAATQNGLLFKGVWKSDD